MESSAEKQQQKILLLMCQNLALAMKRGLPPKKIVELDEMFVPNPRT